MGVGEAKFFTEQDHQTWSTLFARLEACRKTQAHPLFAEGLEKLGIDGKRIPELERVNARLKKLTGWRGVPVTGLEEGERFFAGLARKEFPVGNFIRDNRDLSYTPAPDVFHDLYGHLPFLADRDYATFCHQFGVKACESGGNVERLEEFGRLFWFGVEFPLIVTPVGRRIFGGGILSSFKESNYCLSDEPEVLAFDPEIIRHLAYRIDEMQNRLFLLESPEQLYGCLEGF